MRFLSCKQASAAWRVAATKATQAGDPAFSKVARAMLMFPMETTCELAWWMEHCAGDEASDGELATLEAMSCGRLDRGRLHPGALATRDGDETAPGRCSAGR